MKKLLLSSAVLIIFALASLVFQISSCTKSVAQTSTSNYPIQGLWIGTYTVDGQTTVGEQYFSLIIKPDGTMIADTKWGQQQHLALGTWNLNGNSLSCTFTCVYGYPSNIGVAETVTAIWDKSGNLGGTWKNISPSSGMGAVTLSRVN